MAVANKNEIEKRLWDAADELRANSKLKSSEYSVPVLGLIFLRYADHKFSQVEQELAGQQTGRRTVCKYDYQARGVMYLPPQARFSTLLNLPEGADIAKAINEAMKAIEAENEDLKDVLPKTYSRLDNATLFTLLKTFAAVPMDIEGDAFGKIYEYFLGKFAMSEGQKGGEFFTPTSIVKLIVEVIEPYHGRIFDPACGSGGMFVQSARFVENHKRNPSAEIMVYGQEKTLETVRLCKMNLAVHGLSGDIRQGNTYYEDIHRSVDKFDFVMANPPFNVDRVDKERIKDDPRFPLGLPRADNANYLWIQVFYSALSPTGRAGFVMANSASDARASELEIRQKLIQAGAVDVMVAVGSNFFYTVTLPCTLWFMDKAKASLPPCPPSPQSSPSGRGGYIFQGLKEEARELRKNQTPAEDLLWNLLRDRKLAGLRFRRQHQIGDYIVDFFCPEYGLVVKLDGGVHDDVSRRKQDAKRDAYLRTSGYRVLRFPNHQVFDSIESVLQTIIDNLPSTSQGAETPSPSGRGARGEGLPENQTNRWRDGARYSDTVLFIDARGIFRQLDRAHRDWTPAQIEFLASIARLYRGESLNAYEFNPEGLGLTESQISNLQSAFRNAHDSGLTQAQSDNPQSTIRNPQYVDVPGLCKVATLSEIEAQGWSLNPGRYVGVAARAEEAFDFKERLEEMNEELETLNAEARELEQRIAENISMLLEAEI